MLIRPMTQDEFDELRPRLVGQYAADHVQVNGGSEDDAAVEAERAAATFLPQGVNTPNMLLFTAEVEKAHVGLLWLGLNNRLGIADTAWIYLIEVAPERRGEGRGRALLAFAERTVSERGIASVGLNVRGHNAVALRLYDSAGYATVTQQMRKSLRTDGNNFGPMGGDDLGRARGPIAP